MQIKSRPASYARQLSSSPSPYLREYDIRYAEFANSTDYSKLSSERSLASASYLPFELTSRKSSRLPGYRIREYKRNARDLPKRLQTFDLFARSWHVHRRIPDIRSKRLYSSPARVSRLLRVIKSSEIAPRRRSSVVKGPERLARLAFRREIITRPTR